MKDIDFFAAIRIKHRRRKRQINLMIFKVNLLSQVQCFTEIGVQNVSDLEGQAQLYIV